MLGGGLYEPVLASLPEPDRIAQLERMANATEAAFGRRPTGAWLAERVWEPDLPTSLVAAGYRWTVLDDAHFRAAAIPEDALWGPYTTEDQGRLIDVFGTEQGLRYRIPFREVDEVIAYLREHATEDGRRVGMMGDDGEKFGAWPTTFEHCWGKRRWVERFFGALEANADWLSTTTPSDWLAREPPVGRVYIPTGSYAEMGEWALPANEALAFAAASARARAEGLPELRWLRGAFWRNFQVKYREVNDLHKQMLRTSDKVAAMNVGPAREAAVDHLYQGQSNDCYWHGLFGGVYIGHMRLATHGHLIAAEDLADQALGTLERSIESDIDLDGRSEVLLANEGQVVTVKPDEGAGIGAWDIRAARHALASVMRRRPEAYHDRLRTHGAAEPDARADDAPASIHELVAAKEPDLAAHLAYDGHERRSGLLLLLDPRATAADWAAATAPGVDLGVEPFVVEAPGPSSVTLRWSGRAAPGLEVRTHLEIGGGRLDPTVSQAVVVRHVGGPDVEARLGTEWSTMLLGGGGNPAAWWELDGDRSSHDATREATGVARLGQGNDDVGLVIETTVDPPADVWIAPIETISNSEAGFERAYQGSGLLLSWPLRLGAGGGIEVRLTHRVTVTVDPSG
jgi:alpha-amylase